VIKAAALKHPVNANRGSPTDITGLVPHANGD